MFDGFDDLFDLNGDDPFSNCIDTDGDGIEDACVTGIDIDGDGIMDGISLTSFVDADNDGYADSIVTEFDFNGDGYTDMSTLQQDTDGDGLMDYYSESIGLDNDGDGIFDTVLVNEDIGFDGVFDLTNEYSMDELMDFDEFVPYYDANSDVPDDDPYAVYETDNFDADDYDADDVVGNPGEYMDSWHMQQDSGSCAVVSQEFILEQLLGEDFSEADLCELAQENGWFEYGANGGTKTLDIGNVLTAMGLDVTQSFNNDEDSLREALEEGNGVIVSVDADELWDDDNDFAPGTEANHAITVIGIDYSDPDDPMVIINDSGVSDGCGAMVPMNEFMDAWEDSSFFMVEAAPGNIA